MGSNWEDLDNSSWNRFNNSGAYNRPPVVMVTGFAPFNGNNQNASWEAVQRINKESLEDKYGVEIMQVMFPVKYKSIDNNIRDLWTTHRPKLMIHTGVSEEIESIRLETTAYREGYEIEDVDGETCANNCYPSEGPDSIKTGINVEEIVNKINKNYTSQFDAEISENAGRYLCEYIYYSSLRINKHATLFVHVPDTNVYSEELSAYGLQTIIEMCMKQIGIAE